MKNLPNLEFLIKLMDDDSTKVRTHVATELKKWGLDLRSEVSKLAPQLSEGQLDILNTLENELLTKKLTGEWHKLFEIEDYHLRLEKVFLHIAEYQNEYPLIQPISESVSRLANEFAITVSNKNPMDLAEYLFQTCDFRGNTEDYTNPLNNNLGFVLNEKKGIPISLSCLYMLVGNRLGFEVEGCNLPGHFFTRVLHNGNSLFIDCFNRGKVYTSQELLESKQFNINKFSNYIFSKVEINVIILRIIRNLIKSHSLRDESRQESFYNDLLVKTHKIRTESSIRQASE